MGPINGEPAPLISKDEIMLGRKVVSVTYRWGEKKEVTLRAPSRRESQTAYMAMVKSGSMWPVMSLCLPQADFPEEKNLDHLAPDSAAELETICYALAFGEEALKKSQSLAQQMASMILTNSSAGESKSPSSAPVSQP